MALTQTDKPTVASPTGLSEVIANTVAVFGGGFAALRSGDHATSQGELDNLAATAGLIPLGGSHDAAQTGDGTIKGSVNLQAHVLRNYPVTGVTAATDTGLPVYATDDNTLTLTKPTPGIALGFVLKHLTGTSCDLLMFGAAELAVLAMAGGGGSTVVHLGHVDLPSLAAGDVRTGLTLPVHGAITAFYAMVDIATTGGGATVDLNLEIGGVDVTGGVITIPTAAAKGTRVNGTAITALNVLSDGDLVDVEAAALTAFTTGTVDLYAVIDARPGL